VRQRYKMDAIVIPVDSDRDQDDCPAINMDDINNEISLPSEDDLMNDGLFNNDKIIEPLEVPLDENKESNQSVSIQASVDKDFDFQDDANKDNSQEAQEDNKDNSQEAQEDNKDNSQETQEDSLFKLARTSSFEQKTSIKNSNQTSQVGNDPLFSLGRKQSYDPLGFEEGSSVILLENPSEKFSVVKILYRPTQPGVVSGYLVAIKSQESGSIQWRDSNHILPAL